MDLNECAAFLRERDEYIIVTHRRPDGDTLGSAAGLCHALRRFGKKAWLFPNPEITETFLPYVRDYLAGENLSFSTAVATDVAEESLFCRGWSGEIDLWIDHHPSRGTLRDNAVVWSHKASCGEIIMELIEALCGDISKEEADLLYMAVSTDTGCFVYDNTTAETHRAAALLLDAGADLPALNKPLFRYKSRARIVLEGLICSDLRVCRNDAVSVAVVTLDMLRRSGATEDDCSDLASLAGMVRGNRVAVTVRELSEDPPKSKVSLRTDGEIDASKVCALFGGGGHKMASGCELDCSPEETVERILSAIDAVWE